MRFTRMVTYAGVSALVAAALPSAAQAQFGGGQSGTSTAAPLTNMKPFRELRAFGACFAKTNRRGALTLMSTVPGSREEDAAFRRLVYGDDIMCMLTGSSMAMPIVLARGAVAEGLFLHGGLPDTYRLPVLGPTQTRGLHDVARCYTAGHRPEVEKVLKTEPGSREEVAAVASIWNDFRKCMPGKSARLNAPWIRYLLVEALLRTPPNAPAPAAGK